MKIYAHTPPALRKLGTTEFFVVHAILSALPNVKTERAIDMVRNSIPLADYEESLFVKLKEQFVLAHNVLANHPTWNTLKGDPKFIEPFLVK
jgi:hypothetical protein